jgi:hypothetical protein
MGWPHILTPALCRHWQDFVFFDFKSIEKLSKGSAREEYMV